MALPVPKKSVHLPEEPEASPRPQESVTTVASYSNCGNFSRLVRDISPDVITMWREAEPGLRGELVTDEPSTSGPNHSHTKPRQLNTQQRRKQLRSQPEPGSPCRQGPSNFTKLPDIAQKPRSLPASPVGTARPPRHHRPGSQAFNGRTSLSGNGAPSFVAGATVAGPLCAPIRPNASNTAVTAAALFAISAGQTLTAASIAYTASNGAIAPPVVSGPVTAAAAATSTVCTPETGVQTGVQPPLPGGGGGGSVSGGGMQLQMSGVVRGLEDGGGGLLGTDDDFGGAASGGGGSSGGAAAAALLPTNPKMIEDERLRSRLVSLPNIVCRSANGDVFLVDLGNVQAMLHKRELGEDGLAILNRLTPSLAQSIGGSAGSSSHRRRRRTIRIAAQPRRPAILHSDVGSGEANGGGTSGDGSSSARNSNGSPAVLARAMSMAAGRGRNAAVAAAAAAAAALQRGGLGSVSAIERDPLMEAELERHLANTDELVQQRRQQLEEDWRRRRIVAANPAAAAKEHEEARRAAAIDFAVRQFVPRRLALMALNMPPIDDNNGGGGAAAAATAADDGRVGSASGLAHEDLGSGAAAGAQSSGSMAGAQSGSNLISQSGEQQQAKPLTPQQVLRQFGADFKVHHWKQIQVGIDRMYDKMPFLSNWVSTIKKLHRDEHGGWDGLLHGVDDLYVKGREEHQGTNIYVLKCHELGVTPSTQVIQQLSSADANMSHCNLGRQGAAALRHALSANVTITHLNLQDNHLDATGLESILAGLYSGTMAKQPRARRLLEKRIQTAANSLASAVNGGSGA
ncbi:hypothetical protein VaNZ11_013101, partial [Volvox africanus]